MASKHKNVTFDESHAFWNLDMFGELGAQLHSIPLQLQILEVLFESFYRFGIGLWSQSSMIQDS